jgi:short-subunit dehydrogenase
MTTQETNISQMSDNWLRGQRVLVTGASSGIGAATARAFARAGAVVGICARRADRLQEVLVDCRATAPDSVMWITDLSRLDTIDAFAARAVADLGGVDILVNNAGVPKRRPVTTLSAADAHEVMDVNYFAPVQLTLSLLPQMLERGAGHIVNISSMGAHLAAGRIGAYSASKAALEFFTEALYLDLAGTGVAAHLFVPGSTRTEFSTPKPGNDPPFPADPASFADPDAVAAALLRCLGTEDFITFAMPTDQANAEKRNAAPNEWLGRFRATILASKRA